LISVVSATTATTVAWLQSVHVSQNVAHLKRPLHSRQDTIRAI
jgi:hypothetical protein